MRRYRIPKSKSRSFDYALRLAKRLGNVQGDESGYWLEFEVTTTPGQQFKDLECLSEKWKGSGHYLGERKVSKREWWAHVNSPEDVSRAVTEIGKPSVNLEGKLRYRFSQSNSVRFRDALQFATGLPGFTQEGADYIVELPADGIPSPEFIELESITRSWRSAAYFIGDKRVARDTWWSIANPFGKLAPANVSDGWIAKQEWVHWGHPENLVVGESYRQDNLRKLSGVGPESITLLPVAVLLLRDPRNAADPNAIMALIGNVHVGFIPAERAAVVAKVMDRESIFEMTVAGVVSGGKTLGVHLWPSRLLTEGVIVGDNFRQAPVNFYENPRHVFAAYEIAKENYEAPKPAAAPCAVFLGFSLLATSPLGKQLLTAVFA